MSKIFSNKVEISKEAIRKIWNSSTHSTEFEVDTQLGRAKVRIQLLAPAKMTRKTAKAQKTFFLLKKSGWGAKYFGAWHGKESTEEIIGWIKESRGETDFTTNWNTL